MNTLKICFAGCSIFALLLPCVGCDCSFDPVDLGPPCSDLNDEDAEWCGDDDDSTPEYDGHTNMSASDIDSSCMAITFYDPEVPDDLPAVWFDFELTLESWAADCFINFYDLESGYCEAWHPVTGIPCEYDGSIRGGWELYNDSRNWDEDWGHWEYWTLDFDYIMEIDWEDVEFEHFFICDNPDSRFLTEFCCEDDFTGRLNCVEHQW